MLSLLHARIARLEARAAPTGLGKPPLAVPHSMKCARHGMLEKSPLWDFTSYNILSLELAQDDYYRKLDGTVNRMDTESRRNAINAKVEKWMEAGRIVCLQEVTNAFLSPEANPGLHAALRRFEYDVYHHAYCYQVSRDKDTAGVFTLGLATLVPARLYRVAVSALLWPWKDPVVPPEDQAALARLDKEYNESKNILKALQKSRPTPPASLLKNACGVLGVPPDAGIDPETLAASLEAQAARRHEALLAKTRQFKNITDHKSFKERTVIALALEDASGNRMTVANIHMPCLYRPEDREMMTSLAFRAKRAILDWMAQERVADAPMLLGGDFNSGPLGDSSTAYSCFAGTLGYASSWVSKDIPRPDFEKYVGAEKWPNGIATADNDGCTAFGFTKTGLATAMAGLERFMDGRCPGFARFAGVVLKSHAPDDCLRGYLRHTNAAPADTLRGVDEETLARLFREALDERPSYFAPKQLWLDHFFTRSAPGQIRIVDHVVPKASHVVEWFGGQPIPNLDMGEPSDHLPISLSLCFCK